MDNTIDLSNVINVSLITAPASLTGVNINTVALFTTEQPDSAFADGYKIYVNATDVGRDFGTDSKPYKLAVKFFSQSPNPLSTRGYLAIVPRTSSGAEKIETAIARIMSAVYFFGCICDEDLGDSDFANLATYIQTIDKVFFFTSADAGDLNTSGLFDDVRDAGQTHMRCLYYGGDGVDEVQEFSAAYAARALSTDFSGSETTQTMQYKQLVGITADGSVTQTIFDKSQTVGADIYPSIKGISCLYTSGANTFFDSIYNREWLKNALQTAGFNFLQQTSTKIPQTEQGVTALKNVFAQVLDDAVQNGYVAPGSWTSPDTFGNPADLHRNIRTIGYYIYSEPVASQSQEDREDRKAPLIQIALKEAGAIHTANVRVNINL